MRVVARNGNMLLNIGPRADGTVPFEQQKPLRETGRWLAVNGEAIYGTRPAAEIRRDTEDGGEAFFTRGKEALYLIYTGDRLPENGELVILDWQLPAGGSAELLGQEGQSCAVNAVQEGSKVRICVKGDYEEEAAYVFRFREE